MKAVRHLMGKEKRQIIRIIRNLGGETSKNGRRYNVSYIAKKKWRVYDKIEGQEYIVIQDGMSWDVVELGEYGVGKNEN